MKSLSVRRPRRCTGLTALSLVLMVASACGGTPSQPATTAEGGSDTNDSRYRSVLDEIEGLTGDDRRSRLVELAQDEGGQLNLYTSMNPQGGGQALYAAFLEDTGIKVNSYRASDDDVRKRLLEEARAGRIGADFIEGGGQNSEIIARQGLFFEYEPPQLDNLIDGSKQNGWVTTRLNSFVVEWNTNLVKEGEQPREYTDLSDPKWRGKLAIDAEDYIWFKAVYEYMVEDQGMTEQEADAVWRDIGSVAKFTSGHTSTGELVAAGEYSLFVQFLDNVETSIENGAPVAWQPAVRPIFTLPNGGGPLRDAEHPATALLFLEWVLSDGQEVLAQNNLTPVREDLVDRDLLSDLRVLDVGDYVSNLDTWNEKFERVQQGGNP